MAVLGAYNFDEASGAVLDRSGNGRSFSLSGNSIRDGAGHTANGARSTSTGSDLGPSMYGQTANRTLMMWLKMSADFTGWVFEQQISSIPSGAWGLLCLSGQLGFRARNGGGSTAFASAARITDNAWHHYAGTWDGTSVRLYIDGVLTATVALTGGGPIATADVLYLFDIAVGTPPIIDDVRVLDEVLDAAAITALMGTPVSDVSTVLGTGVATLGSVTGSAVGRRTAAGQAVATFGSLAASAIGSHTVTAVASALLAKVNAVAAGAPERLGTAVAALSKVTGTATGSRTASGTGNAPLSGLLAAATGGNPESVQGAGVAVLGALSAQAQVLSAADQLWLTDADLAQARADQESVMYDRLRIRHDDPVDGAFDPDLGYAPSELPEPFYIGRGRVQARPVQSSDRLIAASQQISLLGYAVAVPWNVTGIRPTDIIEVYESRDPENVGKTLRVSDVQSSTYVTARRMQCIDYQRREVPA